MQFIMDAWFIFKKLGIYKLQLYVLHWGLHLELLGKLLILLEIFHLKMAAKILPYFCIQWHFIFIQDRARLMPLLTYHLGGQVA